MSAQPSQFDTHRFVKRLTKAGISEEVAEILAEEHVTLLLPADVATKSDVAAVSSDVAAVSSDLAAVSSDVAAVSSDLAAVRLDLAAVRLDLAEAKATTEARIAEARTATEERIAEAEKRIRISVREDILTAEARSQAEFTTAVAALKDAIADCKTSTLKWMFGMMTAYTGIVMTAVVTLIVNLK